MPIEYVKGNAIDMFIKEYDVLAHGCNCQCVMGAGIARQISQRWPIVKKIDNLFGRGPEKLGDVIYARLTSYNPPKIVANMYTQEYFGQGIQVDYKAIRSCFNKLYKAHGEDGIIAPKIGCGLGGGDWDIIEGIINDEFKDRTITIAVL